MDRKQQWRIKTRLWAYEALGNECAVCGRQDSLEFDHIEPESKSYEISHGIRDGFGKVRLEEELKKCQLLCLDHHRIKSLQQGSVHHGGGMAGKRHCSCDSCKAKKSEYMKEYYKTHTRKRDRT
jgi:hypothetical protein